MTIQGEGLAKTTRFGTIGPIIFPRRAKFTKRNKNNTTMGPTSHDDVFSQGFH